jgi:MFS family permease
MKTGKATWAPWALCAVVVVATVLSLAISLKDPLTHGDVVAAAMAIMNASYAIAFGVVGALILSRMACNRVGWLLMAVALSLAAVGTLQDYLERGMRGAAAPTFAAYLAAWLSGWSWWLLIGPLLLLLLLFPTGYLLSRRWRWLVGLIALLFVTFMLIALASPEWQDSVSGRTFPNPLGVSPLVAGLSFETIQVPWTLALVGTVALCVLSVFLRYRRSGTVEREQLKWFLYACALFVAIYVATGLLFAGGDQPAWLGILFNVALLLFPLSIGIAILRYRLYDIDILIRGTLVYVPLTAILAGVFAASIRVTQALFAGLVGAQSEAATVLTTLIVVAAFDPLKGWLQRMVSARFKEGPNPEQRWKDYGKQVKTFVEMSDAEASARRLLEEAAGAYGALSGAVFLRRNGEMQQVHTLGEWRDVPEVTVPLEHQGVTVGRLLLGARRNGRPFEPGDLALLADTANAVAAAIALRDGGPARTG